MFELLLVACVGISGCDAIASPIRYATEERCQHQAALLAGTLRGGRPLLLPTTYGFSCTGANAAEAVWTVVPPRMETIVVREIR